jgi:hypothetical protein
VDGFDVEEIEAGLIAPVEELRHRPVVSPTGVRVADVGGEEFDEAAAGMRTACADFSPDPYRVAVESSLAVGSSQGIAPPRLPRIRTCGFSASGSSVHGFAT